MKITDAEVLDQTILLVRHGSHAYGMNLPTSDVDEKGVCIIRNPEVYFGLERFEQKDKWEDNQDRVIYDIRKYFNLALNANPNILEVLFVEPEDILKITPAGERLRANRDLFLSKKVAKSFIGYATTELSRTKRHNEWGKEVPKKPDQKDFISEHLLTNYEVFSREFGSHHITVRAVKPEISWPEPEPPVIKITHFDEPTYRAAERRYKGYHDWMEKRNPARLKDELNVGFDAKDACHLIRLIRCGKELLSEGSLRVKRPDKDHLLNIRLGKISYEEVVKEAEEGMACLRELENTSPLPDLPDYAKARALLFELLRGTLQGQL